MILVEHCVDCVSMLFEIGVDDAFPFLLFVLAPREHKEVSFPFVWEGLTITFPAITLVRLVNGGHP